MSSHGPQFDEFHANATHGHGGAEYDESGTPTAASSAHGPLVDEFGTAAETLAAHGQHWDEFGWTMMPDGHGHSFDTDFARPAALDDATDHGTWFDVFSGGTMVKFLLEGYDSEGVVLNHGKDHLIVRTRQGRDTDIGLAQIRAFKKIPGASLSDAPKLTATPGNTPAPMTRSGAEAPSAHSATASGRGPRTTIDIDTGSKVTTVKTVADVDVRKTLDELRALAAED